MNFSVSFLSLLSLLFLGVHSETTVSGQTVQAPVIVESTTGITLNAETTGIIRFGALSPIHKNYHAITLDGKSIGQMDEMLNNYSADGDTYLFSDAHEMYAFTDKDINSEKPAGEKLYSYAELEDMAKIVLDEVTTVKIDELTAAHGNKEGNYFFRWEDTSTDIGGGINGFVQVGIRKDGWVFSYTYALPY